MDFYQLIMDIAGCEREKMSDELIAKIQDISEPLGKFCTDVGVGKCYAAYDTVDRVFTIEIYVPTDELTIKKQSSFWQMLSKESPLKALHVEKIIESDEPGICLALDIY
jgi:hypothetical protein